MSNSSTALTMGEFQSFIDTIQNKYSVITKITHDIISDMNSSNLIY